MINCKSWHVPKPLSLANKKKIYPKHSAFVVGIINCNLDSFWKESRFFLPEEAKNRAIEFEQAGADILDIGAESTRPGSSYISEEEELSRLIPVIKEIRKYSSIPISVDTRKSSVFRAAFDEGADILNDISAFQDDDKMCSLVVEKDCPVILMHRDSIVSQKPIETVKKFLFNVANYAVKQGIEPSKIILDPGIGFNKIFNDNYDIIKNIDQLCDLKYRVMMALSRKRFIGEVTGKDVNERLSGTLVADLFSVFSGVEFIRVHDVAETVDSLKMIELLSGFSEVS